MSGKSIRASDNIDDYNHEMASVLLNFLKEKYSPLTNSVEFFPYDTIIVYGKSEFRNEILVQEQGVILRLKENNVVEIRPLGRIELTKLVDLCDPNSLERIVKLIEDWKQ